MSQHQKGGELVDGVVSLEEARARGVLGDRRATLARVRGARNIPIDHNMSRVMGMYLPTIFIRWIPM